MGRKSFVSKKEEEADYEYQKYLEKKRQLQNEMMELQKFNVAYQPSNREPLESYISRVEAIAHQLELELQIHYNWYTHKRSPNCPICDSMNLCHYLLQICRSIQQNKKHTYIAVRDHEFEKGTLDWGFIPLK